MRFFSSSALAKAEKLRLAANCSAAETMVQAPERQKILQLMCLIGPVTYGKWKSCTRFASGPHAAVSAGFAGARTVTDPPAFSTAAMAAFDAPWTVIRTGALISPRAS